jgi:hypothetical protein
MIRTLRAFFLSRLLREKLLLGTFVLIAALIWASSLFGRVGRLTREARSTTLALKDQSMWLTNRTTIEEAARKATSKLTPDQTVDDTRLLSEVNAMASEAGLRKTNISEPQDVSNGQIAIHTLQLGITQADWSSVVAFYVAVRARAPYIGIEKFAANGNRTNPLLLDINMSISSVEIVRN